MRQVIRNTLILAALFSGAVSTSSADDAFSNGLPVGYMGLVAPTSNTTVPMPAQPVAGQRQAIHPDHRYTVDVLEYVGGSYTEDLDAAEKYLSLRQHQGFEAYKTESYVIDNGRTRVFHIVHWLQWRTRTQTEDPAFALRQATDFRIHTSYVRIKHHQLMQPGWVDANLNARGPHWESRVTGW